MLSACSNTSESATPTNTKQATAEVCANIDPVKAAATSLDAASTVVLSRTTPATEFSEMTQVSAVMKRATDGKMSLSYNGLTDDETYDFTGVIQTSEATYISFRPGIVDGLTDGDWIHFKAGSEDADAVALGSMIDFAVTGDEDLGAGLYQLGDSYDITSAVQTDGKVLGNNCFYRLNDAEQDSVNYTVTTDTKGRLTTLAVGMNPEDESITVAVDYKDVVVEEPAAADIAPDAVVEAYLNYVADTAVQTAAQSFSRELNSLASNGDTVNNNPNDTDPRKPYLFLEMIAKGDIPDQYTTTSELGRNQVRVLMYNPAGTGASQWTRLFCDGTTESAGGNTPCPTVSSDPTSVSLISSSATRFAAAWTPGHLQNPTRATGPANVSNPSPICLQFHKAGRDAFLGVSPYANTPGVVSSDVSAACPSSMYGNGAMSAPSAVTNGNGYYDISTSAAAGMVANDPTW
jgi:hypothetical protein